MAGRVLSVISAKGPLISKYGAYVNRCADNAVWLATGIPASRRRSYYAVDDDAI